MSDIDFFNAWGDELEDFWGRRESGPRYERSFHLFGWPFRLTSNCQKTLHAVDASLPLFSRAPSREAPPLDVHVVVRKMPGNPGSIPEDLFARIQYSGYGNWLALHLDAWGLGHMALDEGQAVAVIAPALADEPEQLSRHVLNTIFLNLLENRGFSLLHATSVVRGDRLLLLLGSHNSGKSTTALRLALNGYDFLADSLMAIAPSTGPLQLLGFPVGLAKLRRDMLPAFPALQPLFEREVTREEVKFGLDLHHLAGVSVRDEAVTAPCRIDLYFLQRHDGRATQLTTIEPQEALQALFLNSAYWHNATFWQAHMVRLRRLLAVARCRQVRLGSDGDSLLVAFDG